MGGSPGPRPPVPLPGTASHHRLSSVNPQVLTATSRPPNPDPGLVTWEGLGKAGRGQGRGAQQGSHRVGKGQVLFPAPPSCDHPQGR